MPTYLRNLAKSKGELKGSFILTRNNPPLTANWSINIIDKQTESTAHIQITIGDHKEDDIYINGVDGIQAMQLACQYLENIYQLEE